MSWASILKNLLTVCVFTSSAVSTVESYSCANYTCHDDACGSQTQTCAASQGCFSLIQEFKAPAPSSSLKADQKGCSTNKCAELAFSATLGGQRTFGYEQRCCEQEQCNKDFQLPQQSSETNGVECPACYSETDMSCDPAPLKCTGAQTNCVEVITTGVPTSSSLVLYGMGCATDAACGLNMHVFGHRRIRVFCTNSISASPLTTSMPSTSTNGSPLLSSISPVLTGLLLLKVLL